MIVLVTWHSFWLRFEWRSHVLPLLHRQVLAAPGCNINKLDLVNWSRSSRNMSLSTRPRMLVLFAALSLLAVTVASSGDRNPLFQQCLKGCAVTQCDPSQPPIPFYLRLFGWTCDDDCKYKCAQSITDHIPDGSKWHQCK